MDTLCQLPGATTGMAESIGQHATVFQAKVFDVGKKGKPRHP